MSNDLNRCEFIGRLGKDTEAHYMPDGKCVASFSIAIGSQWKNSAGEKQESTEWINCTAFDKIGEICAEYLKKGSQVFVSGKMKTEKYTDKAGIEKYSTKIIVKEMQILGSKQDRTDSNDSKPAQERATVKPTKSTGAFENFDDDIVF